MKKSFFIIMAAVALASCSENEGNAPVVNNDATILLRSTTLNAGATTRTPFIGAIGATNKLTALVPSSATQGNYTTMHADGTMTFNGSGAAGYDLSTLDDIAKAKFPGDDALYLFGAYPAANWAITSGTVTATFDGSQDIMAAQEITTNKAEVQAAHNGSGSFKMLTFNHLLTKLEVRFKSAGANATAAAGYIKSVELVGVKDPKTDPLEENDTPTLPLGITYTPATNTPVFGSEAAAVPFYGLTANSEGVKTYTDVAYTGKQYTLTTSPVYQAYSIVTPVTAKETMGDNEYFIKVVTELKGEKILSVDLKKVDGSPFTGTTAGYSFVITVLYSIDDINVEAVVTDWIEAGETVVGGI